jgi:hypothetical protein
MVSGNLHWRKIKEVIVVPGETHYVWYFGSAKDLERDTFLIQEWNRLQMMLSEIQLSMDNYIAIY